MSFRSSLGEALRTLVHPGPESDYGVRGRSDWLDVDWPAHRHRIELRDREIEYVDLGSGPETIVWVHGLGACWQTWLENLPFFSRTHRCIAMDLPGFGRSKMPVEEISIELYGAIVDELCERLGVRSATVVGNSMGGFIGAQMAVHHAARVERLVLVSAAVLWQEYRRAQPLVAMAQASEALIGRTLVGSERSLARRPRLRAAALALGGFRYPHLLPPELQVEILLTARRTAGFVPALRSLASYPLREELSRIDCPTLVVWGTDDTLVGVSHAKELERLIPTARRVIFERTGHVPMLERPARFNRAMAEFLADDDGPAADRAADAADAADAATAG